MIYRTDSSYIQEYFEHPALNQSGMKVIINKDKGIQEFLRLRDIISNEMYYEDKTHHLIGKAVDCIISEGDDEFKRKYFISTLEKKPSDTLMTILKMTFDNATFDGEDFVLSRFSDVLHQSLKAYVDEKGDQKYYNNRKKDNWGEDTRITSILKDTTNHKYWDELMEANGKQILTDEEKEVIFGNENTGRIGVAPSLLTHRNTSYLFVDGEGIDIVFQFPVYLSVDGVSCKLLIDAIIIDHNRKIIKPLDIKSLREGVLMFNEVAKKWRYDIQGSFYYDNLKKIEVLERLSIRIRKDITEYRVSNFAFVAESTTMPGTPMVFPMSDSMLQVGRFGNGTYLKGYNHALMEYKRWQDADFKIENLYPTGVLFIEEDFKYRA